MRNRSHKILYFVMLVLLLSGAAGSVAGASPGRSGEVKDAGGAKCVERAAGAGGGEQIAGMAVAEVAEDIREATVTESVEDPPEQTVRQKTPPPPEKKHAKSGGRETGEEELPQPSAGGLSVTDLRINNPAVKEYTDKESFLSEYGFDGQEPYYEYFTEDGTLQLELYYDAFFGVGCGLWYDPGEDPKPEGFLFNGSRNYSYYRDFANSGGAEADPYSLLPFDGSDVRDGVEDYEESVTQREDGRPVSYVARGWVTYLTDEKETAEILQIDWSYREDGTLRERDYWHNSMVLGTWYSSRQSYYDEQERLVHEHCYVTHGSVDHYYIYSGESETPVYCLIIDHNLNLLCAELLEYHGGGTEARDTEGRTQSAESGSHSDGTESHGAETGGSGAGTGCYGRIGPMLAGEAENQYAEAALEAAKREGKDRSGQITHTYAADYDGDGREEAFVICGEEVREEYEYGVVGDCWFVNSDLEASLCIDRAYAFDMSQDFICQDGITYLLIRYSIGFPWQAEMYTVRDNAPVEISGSYADKYVDALGQVIQIHNTYDGNCMRTNVSGKQGEEDWRYLWTGHSWRPYTFLLEHGELREVPAREVTREEVERIAPLPDSFDEKAPGDIKQFILRDNGELNVNMAVEFGEADGEWDINFSCITYRLNGDGVWEYVEEQMGYYQIQFSGDSCWSYIEELYQR